MEWMDAIPFSHAPQKFHVEKKHTYTHTDSRAKTKPAEVEVTTRDDVLLPKCNKTKLKY